MKQNHNIILFIVISFLIYTIFIFINNLTSLVLNIDLFYTSIIELIISIFVLVLLIRYAFKSLNKLPSLLISLCMIILFLYSVHLKDKTENISYIATSYITSKTYKPSEYTYILAQKHIYNLHKIMIRLPTGSKDINKSIDTFISHELDAYAACKTDVNHIQSGDYLLVISC